MQISRRNKVYKSKQVPNKVPILFLDVETFVEMFDRQLQTG